MLCLKKRKIYSFTQGACTALPRRSKKDNNHYERGSLNMVFTTLPRNNRSREERPSRMVLTVTEDTPADMLAGSMELLVQLPRDHHLHTQRVTVLRNTPMMDLLVQITTAHKLAASSYTLQAIGERGLVLPHHPNTPIGTLDALQVKLLPKQGTCASRKTKQTNQPFETTFRLQVHLPRNQLYVSRVSPKMNLGEILDEVCREKNLDRSKYELRHPTNLEETLDLSLSLQDYHLQEVTLYAKQTRSLGPTLSTQDIMALQRQEERRRQQTKQSVFGFMFKKSKESSLSTDSLRGRSVSPARSDETTRSASPLQPPARPQRKRRPAPKPPSESVPTIRDKTSRDSSKDKMVINHSRNSSDSSGYHEASVLSDNPDLNARLPETLPRRSKVPGISDIPRKLAQTSQSSKSLGNLAAMGGTLSRGISSTSLSSTGLRKKRAAPPPPTPRPLSSAISTQALERIIDSEESLTSDMDPSKPPSDIGAPSKTNSDIECPKANSDIGVTTQSIHHLDYKPKLEAARYESDNNIQQNHAAKTNIEARLRSGSVNSKLAKTDTKVMTSVEVAPRVEQARVAVKRVGEPAPLPMPRKVNSVKVSTSEPPKAPKRKVVLPLVPPRTLSKERDTSNGLSRDDVQCNTPEYVSESHCCALVAENTVPLNKDNLTTRIEREEMHSKSRNNCALANEDQITRREKISKTTDDIAIKDDTPLKSSQHSNHEIGNNFEIHSNFTEPACGNAAEETYFKSKNKFSNRDEFSQEDRIPDIVNDIEQHKSLNLNQHLSNEEDTRLYSDSTKLSIPATELLSLEYNVIPEKRGNSFSVDDHNVKSKNIDSFDESEKQCGNTFTSSDDDSLNIKSVTKPDCATELRSEQLKLPHHRSVCQRPPRASRKIISSCKIAENIKTMNYVHLKDTMSDMVVKSDLEKDKETCTVISTIPKCERFHAIKEDNVSNSIRNYGITTDMDNVQLCERCQNDESEKSNHGTKNAKRAKVVRSQSKSDDFETDSLKRQQRYLTLPPEDIAYALNLNLPARNLISSNMPEKEREQIAAGHCTNHSPRDMDIDKKESYSGLVTAPNQDISSETEILLRKVSDTLSSVLPASSSPVSETSLPLEMSDTSASMHRKVENVLDDSAIVCNSESIGITGKSNEIYRSCIDFPVKNILSTSTPNMTAAGSQQDTSDYVSAIGEDLSISDWEYQLPAPPSAFRDSHSSAFDDCDSVTLESVVKKPLVSPILKTDTTSSDKYVESAENLFKNSKANFSQKDSSGKMDFMPETEVDIKRIVNKPVFEETPIVSHKSEANPNLRKEIISELENKIETGTLAQTINKDVDRRNMDSLSAPKIAPVDNTLSNFTITTYSKQKSLDIFEEFEESSNYTKNPEDRFIKMFATLTRNNAGAGNYDKESATKNTHLINGTSHNKQAVINSEKSNANDIDCKTELKIHNQYEQPYKWQPHITANEKINIQRSKSYISMSSNAKYQAEAQRISERKHEPQADPEIAGMKKATSITGLNIDVLRSNEKFSQWRNNILKHQEEPTEEKQLQSLQVLKSILPQLKNAQQAEENVSKEYNRALLIEKTKYEARSDEHSNTMNAVSTRTSRDLELECKQSPREESTKRYAYTGPPAISLGSWSERPNVNVQIKMDTDYKLGRSNTNGNKTVVNINGTKNERDITNHTSNVNKNIIAKNEIKIDSSTNANPDDLTKKLIAQTIVSGFKIPMPSRVNTFDSMKNEDRPIVTGVELKKTCVEMPKEEPKNSKNGIDTMPVNFRELTKTFGQHVNFKQKPKRINNRYSAECQDAQLDEIEKIANSNVKQNGHINFTKASNQNDFSFKNQPLMHDIQQNARAKRFTSVVGVNGTSQNLGPQNEIQTSLKCNVNNTMKITPLMPVVKGFKIPITDSKTNNHQINHNKPSAIDDSNKTVQSLKHPTMPVIMGVTLKSANARPKSMPVQLEPRDMLLESIRNFGGREKLKNTAERY